MSENGPHRSENETREALLQHVTAVEAEMVRMRGLLLEKEKERLRLYSKINSLSPFDQLPAEIKTEIFYNAVSPLTALYGSGGLLNPFFLGKICHGWRDFVWSTPILWTTLYLQLSTDNYEAQTILLRDWLSRTGEYPISFCLDTEEFLEMRDYESPIEVLTLFASVSTRWREIEISLPNLRACFDTISITETSLPLLTTATVQLDAIDEELNLLMAPQLSELHLYQPLLHQVLAPWHQLREFFADGCYVDEIRFFLHNAPHIVCCTFSNIESSILEPSLDQELFRRPLLLERLQYLELRFNNVNVESTWILKQVRLPSLREFSLSTPEYSPQDAAPLQITNSFQSSPLLEKFTWDGMVMSDRDLIQALKNIPSVKDLSLHPISYSPWIKLLTGEFLRRLYPPHTEILLPNLRSFSYHGATSLNEDMHLFRDVLVYRFRECALRAAEIDSERTTIAQIKSVSVTSSSECVVSPDIQEELKSLAQAGLEFTFHFRSHPGGMKSLRTLNGVLVLE